MTFSYPRPKNEQDFERLCLKLLRMQWNCPQLELYARRGEKQFGIDLIDLSGAIPLRAAQCKLHEEGKTVTPKEVTEEVEKAKAFQPPVDYYLIVTTGKITKSAQDTVLAINREHEEKKRFKVHLIGWEQVEELLEKYTDVRDEIYGGVGAATAASIVQQLVEIRSHISGVDVSGGPDRYNAEIDEARGYINRGDFQVARLLLERLRTGSWDKLDNRHRFRVLTNLGVTFLGEGAWKKAASLLLQAKDWQPEDELALANEALAYQLLGETEKAYTLALILKERFPSSQRPYLILVRNANPSISSAELLEAVPKHLHEQAEIAVAFAEREIDRGDLVRGEEFARTATVSEPDWSYAWIVLGKVILTRELSQSWKKRGMIDPQADKGRLQEAESHSTRALFLADSERSIERKVAALLVRSRARYLLGSESEGQKDIEEAYKLRPEDGDVLVAYGELLRFKGDLDGAVEALRLSVKNTPSEYSTIGLALILRERGRIEDLCAIADLCGPVARSSAVVKAGVREYAAELAVVALAKAKRWDEALGLVDELPAKSISSVAKLTLLARVHFLKDESTLAVSFAIKASEAVSDQSSVDDLRRLAQLLSELGKHQEALPIWQRIADPLAFNADTRRLLDCAIRLGRHDILMSALEMLRMNGASDKEMLDYEIGLLEQYDISNAIRVLKEEIEKKTDDKTVPCTSSAEMRQKRQLFKRDILPLLT